MSMQRMLDFLSELERNNDRDWFCLLYTSRCV